MVAITATNSTTPSLQASLSRVRLEQAKREADAAEAKAEDLRAQADNAEQEAQGRRSDVRTLSTTKPAEAADPTANSVYSAPNKPSFIALPTETRDFLVRMYEATSPQFAASGNALKDDSKAAPAINTLGQATGRILNLSA